VVRQTDLETLMNAILPVQAQATEFPLLTRFHEIKLRMETAHAHHLGYPYNLDGLSAVPEDLRGFLVNNLGDPYVGSHYASEVCDLERDVVHWLMDLWDCDSHDAYWGSVGTSGTEGNFWALYLAREAMPEATLIYTREAHYSIPKAAKILRINSVCVECEPGGAVDLSAFAVVVEKHKGKSVIVALTCGTTVKGAHDDIGAAMTILKQAGFDRTTSYVHVDGALNAMVLPFAEDVPFNIMPSFGHGIDSISASGHKMIGTPMPCGVLIARRHHVERIASAVAYLRSNDTTLMGSRNGHAVLAIWARLFGHGKTGYRSDVKRCIELARELATQLRAEGVPVLLNPFSLTVYFPQPNEDIVKTYQLACKDGMAHAIMMPNVTSSLFDQFTSAYLAWWKSQQRLVA
jgi:histidine decarboxylase